MNQPIPYCEISTRFTSSCLTACNVGSICDRRSTELRECTVVLERGIWFSATTERRPTLRWATRDQVDKTMETLWVPVEISTTSLPQKLTDRHKMEFPSSGPHTWGYSTMWHLVPPLFRTVRVKSWVLDWQYASVQWWLSRFFSFLLKK
jgi:hypothetical protein